jgi:hypothetical protein
MCISKIITTNCLSVTFSFISILWLNSTLRGTVWLQTLLVSFVMCKEISAQVSARLSTEWNTKELTTLTALICLIMVNQESSAQMNKLEVHVSSNMTKEWWLQSFSKAWNQTQSNAGNNIYFEISESVLLFNSLLVSWWTQSHTLMWNHSFLKHMLLSVTLFWMSWLVISLFLP